MSQTILQKGFKVIIPDDIQRRVVFKEGEKLIVKLAGRDAIVLQRPPKEKDKKEVFQETFGIWNDEVAVKKSSVTIVNKIRKSWSRTVD